MSDYAFRKRTANLNEAELTRLHRDVQRQQIGGGSGILVGIALAMPTGGVSMIPASIAALKMYQRSKKMKIIEAQLKQKGWAGHSVTARDFVIPVAVGAAGLAAAGAVDMAFDSDAPEPAAQETSEVNTSIPMPPEGLDAGASAEGPEFSAPSEGPDLSAPPEGPDLDVPPDVSGQPAPASIPNITWDVTDQGVQMLVDGQPIESTYGSLDPLGFYQVPIDPSDPTLGSLLLWDDPLAVQDLTDASAGVDYQSPDGAAGLIADTSGNYTGLTPEDGAQDIYSTGEWPPGIGDLTASLSQPVAEYNIGPSFSTYDTACISPPSYDMLDPSLTQPIFGSGDPAWAQPTFELNDPSLNQPSIELTDPFLDQPFSNGPYESDLPIDLDDPSVQATGLTSVLAGVTITALHTAPHVAPHVAHATAGLIHDVARKVAQKGTEHVVRKELEKLEDEMDSNSATPKKPTGGTEMNHCVAARRI